MNARSLDEILSEIDKTIARVNKGEELFPSLSQLQKWQKELDGYLKKVDDEEVQKSIVARLSFVIVWISQIPSV